MYLHMTNLGTPCNWLTFSPTTIPFFFWPITATRTRSPGRKTSTSIKLGRGRRIKIMINFKHWQFNQNEQNSSYSKKNPNWICLPRIHAPRHMQIVILQKKTDCGIQTGVANLKTNCRKTHCVVCKNMGWELETEKSKRPRLLKTCFFLGRWRGFLLFS